MRREAVQDERNRGSGGGAGGGREAHNSGGGGGAQVNRNKSYIYILKGRKKSRSFLEIITFKFAVGSN